jgi:hypothetical protein
MTLVFESKKSYITFLVETIVYKKTSENSIFLYHLSSQTIKQIGSKEKLTMTMKSLIILALVTLISKHKFRCFFLIKIAKKVRYYGSIRTFFFLLALLLKI